MSSSTQRFEFKIPCQSKAISKFLEEAFAILDRKNHEVENLNFKFELAAREMLANAIEHGCAEARKKRNDLSNLEIFIVLEIRKEEIVFSVKDCGNGFKWKDYDLNTMPCFEEKGRGLKMINNVVDHIEFNKVGNKITVYFY